MVFSQNHWTTTLFLRICFFIKHSRWLLLKRKCSYKTSEKSCKVMFATLRLKVIWHQIVQMVFSQTKDHILQKIWWQELFFQSISTATKMFTPEKKKKDIFMNNTFQWHHLLIPYSWASSNIVLCDHFWIRTPCFVY